MKRNILKFSIAYLLILNFQLVSAQTYLVPVKLKGSRTCEYINLENETVIKTKKSSCFDFSKEGTGLISSHQNEEFYLIDTSGKYISTSIRLEAYVNSWTKLPEGFHDGMIRVETFNGLGAINSDGKLVVPDIYKKLTKFNCGYAIGKRKRDYYLINKKGETRIIDKYKIKYAKHFSEGLAAIEIAGEYFGFIDTSGNLVIDPGFYSVGYFNSGLAWAKNLDGKVGFINRQGEWVIEPTLDMAFRFDEESGLARVKKNDKWGYIDTLGNFKQFDTILKAYNFSEGLAIGRSGDKVGYINNKGEWVIDPIFHVAHDFKNGHARVEMNGSWGLIDKNGEWVVKPIYESVRDVSIIK